jgi:hypothetical protein
VSVAPCIGPLAVSIRALFTRESSRNASTLTDDAGLKRQFARAPDALEQEWDTACEKVGVRGVPFQQGTCHATLTALSEKLPERVLREFSRHRSSQSLDHYTRPRATPAAIIRVMRPHASEQSKAGRDR